jgi:hypothetical protein
MTKIIFIGALLGSLGLSGACGSSDPGQSTDPACTGPTGPGCSIAVNDRSFVRWTGPATDGLDGGSSTAVVEHTPGKFCMSGTVDAGPNGSGWGAMLTLALNEGPPMTGRTITPFARAYTRRARLCRERRTPTITAPKTTVGTPTKRTTAFA